MAFASFEYFVFLLFAVATYYLAHDSRKKFLLLIYSLLFIGLMSGTALLVVLFATAMNYALSKISNRSLSLGLSLFANITMLVFLKSIISLINVSGANADYSALNFLTYLIPVGLSYYIFQMIAYHFNLSRKTIQPQSFSDLLLLNTFFPKFVSGPVEDAAKFIGNVYAERKITYNLLRIGFVMILIGLFKKLVIADRIALVVDVVHANPLNFEGPVLILTAVLYVFQIYADFSGYTDIALGSATLFGFNLIQNFTNPLTAGTVSEFWRRWHISLSEWINKYIYTPISLLISMRFYIGKAGIALSLFLTFFIVGLWHGFHLNFMIFGALQGIALSYEILSKKLRKSLKEKFPAKIYSSFSVLATFTFIAAAMIFLRSQTFEGALHFFNSAFLNFSSGLRDIIWVFKSLILGSGNVGADYKMFLSKVPIKNEFFLLRDLLLAILFSLLLFAADYFAKPKTHLTEQILLKPFYIRWPLYIAAAAVIVVLGVFDNAAFIYAKF